MLSLHFHDVIVAMAAMGGGHRFFMRREINE
jgi:hypothetical protein